MHDVFISYRRRTNSETARVLRTELEARGYNVFLDVDDLREGHFNEALLAEIAASTFFLVVLAPGSLDRCNDEEDWLYREVRQALATDRKILPLLMPNFAFPEKEKLPEDMRGLLRHHGLSYSHEFFEAMMDRLCVYLGSPRYGRGVSRHADESMSPAAGRARRGRKVAMNWGFALLALAAGGGWFAFHKMVPSDAGIGPKPAAADNASAPKETADLMAKIENLQGQISQMAPRLSSPTPVAVQATPIPTTPIPPPPVEAPPLPVASVQRSAESAVTRLPEGLAEFLRSQLSHLASNDPSVWADDFAAQVDYCYAKGPASRAFIQNDHAKILSRYPDRLYDDFSITNMEVISDQEARATLTFSYRYNRNGKSVQASGRSHVDVSVKKLSGSWKITRFDETVTRN